MCWRTLGGTRAGMCSTMDDPGPSTSVRRAFALLGRRSSASGRQERIAALMSARHSSLSPCLIATVAIRWEATTATKKEAGKKKSNHNPACDAQREKRKNVPHATRSRKGRKDHSPPGHPPMEGLRHPPCEIHRRTPQERVPHLTDGMTYWKLEGSTR